MLDALEDYLEEVDDKEIEDSSTRRSSSRRKLLAYRLPAGNISLYNRSARRANA